MNRRQLLTALAVAPIAAALAACGDLEQVSTTSDTTPTTAAPATIAHPTGSDEVVIKLSYEGGLVPVGYAFASVPALLVSGDLRMFSEGPIPAIFPGPLLPNILVQHLSEADLQAMLRVVEDAGLLAPPPDYRGGGNVADAPNTVVTINAAGGSFVHSAYALGIGDPETPARQKLLDAVTKLRAPGAASGTPYAATTYRLQARVVDPDELSRQEPPGTVVDWPADAGVSLAAAGECARVEASAIGSLFVDAKQNTYFKENDVVYQVSTRGVLPGDPTC